MIRMCLARCCFAERGFVPFFEHRAVGRPDVSSIAAVDSAARCRKGPLPFDVQVSGIHDPASTIRHPRKGET